jgi:hypothetical protein
MSYMDMMAFLGEAVLNKCPDLKNIIMNLAAADINIARQKDEEKKKAEEYNQTYGPSNVASESGGGGRGGTEGGGEEESGGAPEEFSAPPGIPGYEPVITGAPGSTGNAHSYEEQAAEYSQKLREFEEARQRSQEAADAQIKASNEAREKAEQELKEKYESGNPNAVCGPGEWWDGRSCRSVMMNRAGGLVNQAMNLGPSGAAQMVTPGMLDINPGSLSIMGRSLGRRSFPVVNL